MRLITYLSQTGPRIAARRNGGYVDLNRVDAGLPLTMSGLLSLGREGLTRAAAALKAGEPFHLAGVKLLAPVTAPEKVICIGLNYADHAEETGVEVPKEPVVFGKFPTAVAGHGDDIVLPRQSREVDYEAELVVVIGVGGRHIPREDAWKHIAGYACGNDVSARDWQLRKPGGQWLLGKTFDKFAPFGPELVTADEAGDPGAGHSVAAQRPGDAAFEHPTANLPAGLPRLLCLRRLYAQSGRYHLHRYASGRGHGATAAGEPLPRRRSRGGNRRNRRVAEPLCRRVVGGPRSSRPVDPAGR